MLKLALHRLAYMAITLLMVSVVTFVIIQLPPGDYADAYAAKKAQGGGISMTRQDVEALRHTLGLDRPLYEQYLRWMSRIVFHGDFGWSMEWRRPVVEVIGERLPLTLTLAFSTLIFMYAVALPIGIYS